MQDHSGNPVNPSYKETTTKVYQTRDAYRHDDPYQNQMAYDKSEDGGFGLCAFWFLMKVKMQEMMSSDIGLQKEKRIVTMDTDPFKIMLAVKMTARSFSNMLFIPLVVLLSYILYIKAGELFKLTIITLDTMYILWVLWCPGHQTYTSGAYAIHRNSIDLYKNWRVQFKFYQWATIFSFLLGTMFVAGVSYFHEVYNYALNYTQIAFDYIHYPVQLGNVDREAMQDAAIMITSVNGAGVLAYFLFVSYLTEKAKEQRQEYKKTNINDRTNSILEQKRNRLRGV